jgi:hypothetical protein
MLDAGRGYPVALFLQHVVECVDGGHFVATRFFELVVDYKEDELHVTIKTQRQSF